MQPTPEQNQTPTDPSMMPTVPLVQQQQGLAGGQGLMPVQSTLPPEPYELAPLPAKPAQMIPSVGPPEVVEAQEMTEVETVYSSEVDAPHTLPRRMRRTSKTIRFLFTVIEIILAFRFFLKLIGANPSSPFGSFLFGLTDPLVAPFNSLVANPGAGQSEVELTTLLALIVYPVFGWMVIRGIQLMFYHEQGGQQTVRQKRRTERENF